MTTERARVRAEIQMRMLQQSETMCGKLLGADGQVSAGASISIDNLRELAASLPPPVPELRVSMAATMMPDKEPLTDDMRDMVDRIGKQRAPAILDVRTEFGRVIVAHPDAIKPERNIT